jgi:hypothetical protein
MEHPSVRFLFVVFSLSPAQKEKDMSQDFNLSNIRNLLGLGRRTKDELRRLRLMGYGEDENDLYKVDVNGYGYKTQEDYDNRQNKMVQESDGLYYPQQYGK